MAWKVSADPVDFDEAIAWFRKRVSMPKAAFTALSATSKRKAFTVAGVAQLDLVAQVWAAVDAALKKGTPLADFKKEIGGDLRRAWSGTVEDPPWRLETIFRTNVQLAYGAGRYKQAKDPDVASDRPVWMFDAILDGRETDICHACDGTKLPNDDTWWATHTPPLHFNCRSGFIALSEAQAGRITLVPPKEKPPDGFGLTPGAEEWEPDTTKYPAPLAKVHVAKQVNAPPAPPPARLEVGTHIKRLSSEVADDRTEALLDSITEPELLAYLKKRPLAVVVLRTQAKNAGEDVNGWYSPRSAAIEVTADRAPWLFNRPWKPGVTHSISSSQTTTDKAAAATLRHELGHHIHHDAWTPKVDGIVKKAYARAKKRDVYITDYANRNRNEYFAESFAAYYLRRNDLREHDPNGFKMVEDVLTERGILP